MKRNVTRGFLAIGMPFIILFGGYHLTYHLGRLTNHIMMSVWNVKLDMHLPLVGVFGLCIFLVALFLVAVLIKALWFWAGKIMDWYDSKQSQRQAARDVEITRQQDLAERSVHNNRERDFRAALRNNLTPGGEVFPDQPRTIRVSQLRPESSDDEEEDEDRQYRQRIGVEE